MHTETLAPETKRVLEKIAVEKFLDNFYLAGGNALALFFGHRISVDLDFFSPEDFSLPFLRKSISELGSYTLVNEEPGTLDGVLDDVKLTFLRYPYPALFPFIFFGGVRMADPRDIACMKLDAVSSRGSRKDFVDLYVLMEKYKLADLLDLFEKKYSGIHYNRLHLLKSLTYFIDAEEEPMPRMLQDISWEEIKMKISEEAKFLAV